MVRLWEIATGKIRCEIRLPRNSVNSIAFLGHRYLVCGGQQGRVRIHDLANNEWLPVMTGHRDRVVALTLSPDGRTFVSGSWDTTALVWSSEAVIGQRPLAQVQRTARELEALWEDLTAVDPVRGYRATWALTGTPTAASLLEGRVRPIPIVTDVRLKALLAELDGDEFRTREQATAELGRLAELAAPAMREILRRSPSPEVRRRVEGLLAGLETGEYVLARALEVLERLGTQEARRVLEAMAGGAPGARLTQGARAALERMKHGR